MIKTFCNGCGEEIKDFSHKLGYNRLTNVLKFKKKIKEKD